MERANRIADVTGEDGGAGKEQRREGEDEGESESEGEDEGEDEGAGVEVAEAEVATSRRQRMVVNPALYDLSTSRGVWIGISHAVTTGFLSAFNIVFSKVRVRVVVTK